MQTGRRVSWPCLVGLVMTANALGQSQDGRALDANLQLYSSGVNPEIQVFDAGASNRVVTGNVTGGFSFQGFSPVGSGSSLMMGIPTSGLNSFRRDSFSLTNLTSTGSALQSYSYFAPERTATTLGAIKAGVNLPGSTYDRAALTLPRFDLVGLSQRRAADRLCTAWRPQEPPRTTRDSPAEGPVGSTSRLFP